jgi:hypothetical protein
MTNNINMNSFLLDIEVWRYRAFIGLDAKDLQEFVNDMKEYGININTMNTEHTAHTEMIIQDRTFMLDIDRCMDDSEEEYIDKWLIDIGCELTSEL